MRMIITSEATSLAWSVEHPLLRRTTPGSLQSHPSALASHARGVGMKAEHVKGGDLGKSVLKWKVRRVLP
jgi:hypothetical protein